VLFGPTGAETNPVRSALTRVNKDNRVDLLLSFDVDESGFRCGDTRAVLTGQTDGGIPVQGSDRIQVE
jgi:hypothetical protein